MKVLSTLIAGASLFVASHSFAADRQVHLRGEVTAVSDTEMTISDRKGVKTTVKLPEQAQVLDVSRSGIEAIQENSYLGVAAAPAPQGKVRALGVMVFPEAARGVNEGHFPWDMGDRGTMTNATVAKLLKKKSTTELDMRFGAKVLVIGAAVGDTTAAQLVMVGRDGFLPPI